MCFWFFSALAEEMGILLSIFCNHKLPQGVDDLQQGCNDHALVPKCTISDRALAHRENSPLPGYVLNTAVQTRLVVVSAVDL